MNITEFLLARLLEEEQLAYTLSNSSPWKSAGKVYDSIFSFDLSDFKDPWSYGVGTDVRIPLDIDTFLQTWSPGRALREIAAKRRIIEQNPCHSPAHERLTEFEMHQKMVHPAYEYETTETARKAGDSREPEGEGWEPNLIIACDWEKTPDGRFDFDKPTQWRNWERFEHTEDEYWRRLRPNGPKVPKTFIPAVLKALASVYSDHPDCEMAWLPEK